MHTNKAPPLPQNPRERANPLSALMFCTTLPILFKGRKKNLDQTDLYCALKEHKSDVLGDQLEKFWQADCKAKHGTNKKPSLLAALLHVFGIDLALTGVLLCLLEFSTKVSQPICLAGMIAYFAGDDPDIDKAHFYMGAFVVMTLVFVTLMHPHSFWVNHMGMKARIALSSLIYRKTLRLSRNALGDTTTGHVVNLMSNDVGRLDSVLIDLHFLWIGPLELIVITYLMYEQIGISAIFGVCVMLLFLPFQSYLGNKASKLRLLTALRTDERVRMMNEIIMGIQVIKMYAWEKPFGKLVEHSRIREMKIIKAANNIRGMLLSFAMFLSRISIFASLIGYVLLGQVLDAEKAFLITAYYNILRFTVTLLFPLGITQYAELMVCIKRIEDFMLLEEVEVCEKSKLGATAPHEANDKPQERSKLLSNFEKPITVADSNNNYLIEFNDLTAKWDEEVPDNTLDDINLRLRAGQLVAVIGPVGAGKSSLLQAVLNELPAKSGSVNISGKCSYASQEPWLFTGTVRANILFGMDMDEQRYRTVVKNCALERDFQLLQFGDKTIVGERGVSLSGGQKARISLARAVYRQSDIYLLDDPLSAVDTHVGWHLFDQCMRGFLHSKLVLLVTHQLQFLMQADLIVIMDKGKVTAMGTYAAMLSSGLDFAQLLTEYNEDKQAAGDAPEKQLSDAANGSQVRGSIERTNSFKSSTSVSSIAHSAMSESPMQLEEARGEGNIGMSLYVKYFGAGSGFFMFSFLVFLCAGSQVFGSGVDYFLVYWVKKNKDGAGDASDTWDLYYFTALTLALVIFTVVRTFLFSDLAMKSSTTLHNGMFRGVIHAALYFFNVNPSGRILNRFSKDLGQIDEALPRVMTDLLQVALTLFGIIAVVCITNPWYIVVTTVLGIIFYSLRAFYLNTSRDLKRLEAVARSPIYTHLSASLNGLPIIRSFEAQHLLIAEFDNYQDEHSSPFYTFLATNRAFGHYLDFFCAIYIVIIALSFLIYPPKDAGEVGLAITQAMGITGMVQWGMRQSTELENLMTSVERADEYDRIEPEGEFESALNKKPAKDWPRLGEIIAKNLSLRYFPDANSEYVLKSLNFQFKSCEKIGIVGRTGAGKSSLINALFRLSYNEGAVFIDNLDTNEIGLHDLRSKISIIPQEPVLFSGTMRYNLDPFEQYDDSKLWSALEDVNLKAIITELPDGLQSKITEGGSNFSVGQRQLVCLARAVLRENKILVMDEATANVDPQTDALIQATIKSKFKDCTVVTIAHRLHTIIDSDKVLVMDAGQIVEFGSPYELLTNSDKKIFYGMVMQMGKATFENLLRIAEKVNPNQL